VQPRAARFAGRGFSCVRGVSPHSPAFSRIARMRRGWPRTAPRACRAQKTRAVPLRASGWIQRPGRCEPLGPVADPRSSPLPASARTATVTTIGRLDGGESAPSRSWRSIHRGMAVTVKYRNLDGRRDQVIAARQDGHRHHRPAERHRPLAVRFGRDEVRPAGMSDGHDRSPRRKDEPRADRTGWGRLAPGAVRFPILRLSAGCGIN